MVYIEYISRRPGVELTDFQRVVNQVQECWQSSYEADQLILNAGRTWRLGEGPEYLGVWYSRDASFERLDDWEKAFRARTGTDDAVTMSRVARIDFAGCYQPLIMPRRARSGIYYLEKFRPRASDDDIRALYEKRAREYRDSVLNLLVRGIGRLAPDPGGVAVWTIPNYAALGAIVDFPNAADLCVELTTAGVYVDIGREIL